MPNQYTNSAERMAFEEKVTAVVKEHGKVWEDGRFRYFHGWSDERVVKELQAPLAMVRRLRTAAFGRQRSRRRDDNSLPPNDPSIRRRILRETLSQLRASGSIETHPRSDVDRLWMEGGERLDKAKSSLDSLSQKYVQTLIDIDQKQKGNVA